MSKDTGNSLFIDFSLPRFYQQLIGGIGSYQELGNRIIKQVRSAHAFRRVEQVRELSSLLLNIPIKEYQLIAQYYLVWCDCRELKFNNAALETIIEQTKTYKTKALSSRGAFEWYKGNNEAALYFYVHALKVASTISEYIDISRAIAVLKSQEGFPARSIAELENLIPLIRYAEPLARYEFLNSYAVELGKVGRKSEARNVIKHVLASPFIHAYPEWNETAQELKEPSHSTITVPSIEPEHVEVETIEAHHASEPEQEQPPTVLAFPALKAAPQPQRPDRLSPLEVAELTPIEKRELILTALRSGAIHDNEYDKLLSMVGLMKSGPADKILDLEDEAVLDDIAVIWPMQIGAEELVGFLSALRDCDDSFRLKEILDKLIQKVYHETQDCGLSEAEWRLRVERRLPKK